MFKTCLLVGQPYFCDYIYRRRQGLASLLPRPVRSILTSRSLAARGTGRWTGISGSVRTRKGWACLCRPVISGHGISAAEAKKDESGLSEPLTSSSNQL